MTQFAEFLLAVDTGWTLTLAVSMYDLLISRSSKCVYFFNWPKLLGVDNRLVISKAIPSLFGINFMEASMHVMGQAQNKLSTLGNEISLRTRTLQCSCT